MKKSFIRKISTGTTIVSSLVCCLNSISYANIPEFSRAIAEERLGHSLNIIAVNGKEHVLLSVTELCDFYNAKGNDLNERLEFLKNKVCAKSLFCFLGKYCCEPTSLNNESIILLKYFGCCWTLNTANYLREHIFYWLPVGEGENLPIVYMTPREYLQMENENLKSNRKEIFKDFPDLLKQVEEEEKLM